jgi:hypothetical protein
MGRGQSINYQAARVRQLQLIEDFAPPQTALARDRRALLNWSRSAKSKFTFDCSKLAEAMGAIDEATAKELCRDARMTSKIIEAVLEEHLDLARPKDTNAPYDLSDDHHKSEVRCLTKGGVRFAPNWMYGSGRSFEEKGFFDKLNQVEGFYVADIIDFPNVVLHTVSSSKVRHWYKNGELNASAHFTALKARAALRRLA